MLANIYARYYHDPVLFAREVIGVEPTDQQKLLLSSVAEHPLTSCRSGHGIGKTSSLAWLVLWFLSTRPFPMVPCTAPTAHQLHDILWPEINKWLNKSPIKQHFQWLKTKLYLKEYEDTWFAVPRSCDVPDNMAGFHGDNLLYIIDEASGVPPELYEAIEGSLTGSNAKLIMTGNPTRITGTFFHSFHKDRAMYNTLHFSSEDSPLVDDK